MCVHISVRFATRIAVPWDPDRRTLTVPAGLSTVRTMAAVRTVLTEMGVEQPSVGAVCWCGQPVEVWLPCSEVKRIGA